MQTVNFHCPHCGNLMAVGMNLLGRNVRCPHCKQVVRAPAAAGEPPAVSGPVPQAPPLTPAPPPQFKVPTQTEHHESIFGERHDEDLFGSEPLKPTLPTVAAPPTMPDPQPPPTPPPPRHVPQYEETRTYEAPAPLPDYSLLPPDEPRHDHRPTEPVPQGTYRPRSPRQEPAGTPAFTWILLAYAVLATVAAGVFGYLYLVGGSKAGHPFEAIPDFYGQYEKATGAENRKQLSYQGLPDPKLDVPPNLRVRLGGELTVGDLQVRPTKVVKQAMAYTREDAVKGPITNDASTGLALALEVKNLSADTTFHPNDPAFNRAFDPKQPVPYTALQVRREFFYGPFAWPMPDDTKDNSLIGFAISKEPLGPGQERTTWVTVAPRGMKTAGDRQIDDTIRQVRDKQPGTAFLWRVQLRRGSVKARAGDGREVHVSATTVIGVEFKADDIQDR